MRKPWLSVLIPTYNGERYLSLALDSILNQGCNHIDNIECIIVDDGSTDCTISLINSYKDQLPIRLIERERYGNWVASTNYALSIAQGDYICFLHQDDLWLPNRLKILKGLVEKHPEANLFLHASQFIDSRGACLGMWRCPLPIYPNPIDSHTLIKKLLIQNFISIPAPLFKREVALEVGGLDEKLWYTADWDFWLKLATWRGGFYYPKALSAFRVHPDSQTIKKSSSIIDFQKQMSIVLDNHYDHWQADRRLKGETYRVAQFSIEVNTTLAALVHGEKGNLFGLLYSFLMLGFPGWQQYLYNSRIFERLVARMKAKIAM
jgi:glycosyltransferase involved in cell wall biosynthesis